MRKILFFAVICLAVPLAALAQDSTEVDAKHYKVLLENEQVRVVGVSYNVKEKSVMHSHLANVAVFLDDINAKFTFPDGQTTDVTAKAGDVQFSEALTHLPENTGGTPFRVILVELKGKPAMAKLSASADPVEVDPEHHKVVLENDHVRVLRINYQAKAKTKQHGHPNGVAVFLTDTKVRFHLADGKTRDGGGKRGEVLWAAGESHIIENTGGGPAEVILVELK